MRFFSLISRRTPTVAFIRRNGDTFALLGELEQPEYELAVLVATCGFRISEALGHCWRDILWDRAMISIRQTCVHNAIQDGAKTLVSRSRVEVPQLALDVLIGSWERLSRNDADREVMYNDELTACTWALNSAVECHLHTLSVGSN